MELVWLAFPAAVIIFMSDKECAAVPTATVEIKSKFDLEFRRISVPRCEVERLSLETFYRLVTDAHRLPPAALVRISYQDPRTMRLTDLKRSSDLATALQGAAPLLRLFVSRLRGVEVEVGIIHSALQYMYHALPGSVVDIVCMYHTGIRGGGR